MKSPTLREQLLDVVEELIRCGVDLRDARGEFERIYAEKAMQLCHNNRTAAAEKIGVHRNTLTKYIKPS